MNAGTAPKSAYLEELGRKIAEKFERVRVPDVKPRPIMTLEERAEILFNVALRKMG